MAVFGSVLLTWIKLYISIVWTYSRDTRDMMPALSLFTLPYASHFTQASRIVV